MNNDNNINYRLERYIPGGRNRYTCPHCGRKKCFTRYVNTETGEYVDDTCGKCNHESSCGYHYPPLEYHRDHPEQRPQSNEKTFIGGSPCVIGHTKPRLTPATLPLVQTEFFPLGWAIEGTQRPSTFSRWFCRLPFPPELKQQVLADYYVGGTRYDISIDHINYGPAVVFWLIDEKQQVHDAKLMAYQTNGHRLAWGNSARAICAKTGQGPQLTDTEKVLFGLHLLPKYPDKTVCIVESEKTALVCACRYPHYLWLATGGCGQLQPAKLKPLLHRRVVVYPDSGEYDKWCQQMKLSGHHDYSVVDWLEPYPPNTDLADFVLGEVQFTI